ncbi:hypothetical protein ABPG74_010040 [Tetrahymena malaccensis]
MNSRKTQYDKIAASLNNSAAIDKNGEVYVWGLAKTGILGDNITTNQYQPTCMNIKGLNQQYKAVHISMGLNHIAVIVNYAILDLIDFNNIPPSSIHNILEAHSQQMNQLDIDVLKYFQSQIKQQRFIERRQMEEFLRQKKFPMEKDQNQQISQVGFSVSQVQEFYDFFCMKDPTYFNIVEYFYQTNKTKIKGQKLIVWGISDSGRLGLKKETLEIKSKNKVRRKGQKLQENTSESDDDDQFQKNENQQSFVRSYVNKTEINEEIKDGIKHVSCGHHHTLVITDQGSIFYFGMGTQGQLGNENFVNVYEPTELQVWPKRKFIQVACGSSHSMALTDTGQIFTWGKNTRGQLGHGHRNDQLKPTMIIIEVMATSICSGDQHSAFISDEKELYTWGNGQYFRLGHGVTADELYPKKVVVLEDVYVTHVSCGMTHTLAITNEGFVYAWGDGMSGKLGVQENNKNLHLPSRVGMNDVKFRKKVYYQVSAGGLHSMALTDQGILYAWGSSKGGVLGIGFQRDNKESYSLPQKIRSVAKIQSKHAKQIQFFSIKKFLKEQRILEQQKIKDIQQENENENDSNNKLGDQSISFMDSGAVDLVDYEINFIDEVYPLKLIFQNLSKALIEDKKEKDTHKKIIFIVASANNSFFISDIGQIHACGSPKKGLLIMDPKNEKLIIRKKKLVMAQKDFEVEKGGMQSIGGDNSSVGYSRANMQRAPSISQRQQSSIKSNTLASVQQKNQKKNKQQPEQNYSLIFDFPFLIPYFKNKIIYMSCSYTHAIAISHKGVAYSWGSNKYYQLGLGYMCKYNHIPQKIQGALETKRIIMSTCSDRFSALLTDKGEVWTFGTSDSGVLGHDEKNYYVVSEPKMINDIPPMIFLASGPQGMMAITEQKRQIYAWGNNLYGQLGIQITNNNMNMNQFGPDIDDSQDEIKQKEKKIDLDEQNKKITKNQIIYKPMKVKIENDRKIQIRFIGMGMFHSVAIDDLGHLYSCGLRKFSGLAESLSKEGLAGFDDTFIYLKKDPMLNHQFQQVSVSEYHTLALTQDQTGEFNNVVFGWGLCNLGNLCLKDQKDIQQAMKDMKYQMKDIDLNDPLKEMFTLPINLTQLNKFQDCDNIVYISAGLMHNLAMNKNGKVFSWGSFQNGRLGISTTNLNLPPEQFFTTEPQIVSVLFDETKDENEIDFHANSNYEPSQKKSTQSKMKSQAASHTMSKQKTLAKTSAIGQSQNQQQQSQQQQGEEEEDENDEDYQEINDAEIDILEQSSFGSDSSKDVFSSDSNINVNEDNSDNSMQNDSMQNSIDQDLSQMPDFNDEDNINQTIEQMNLYSKLPNSHKRQDEVQKKIWKEEDSCLEENLIKQDKDLEDLAKQIIFKCLKLVYENEKNIQQAESKIESIIQTQIKNQANSKQLELLEKLYFNIPSFVIKNIQLYETVFSLLYYHPCYILNLLKTNCLTIFHLKSLINVLFKNPIDVGPSNFTLITLTIETFKHEYKLGSIHINDIKNIQQSSLFWHLYTLLFERQKTTIDYFKKLVKNTIGQDICVQIYMAARLQLNKDNPKQLTNLLDYLQGTQKEIQLKSQLLLRTIQPLMSQIASDFQDFSNANQQIFTEELIFVHNKIVNFAKKFSLKKHAQSIRKEQFQERENDNLKKNDESQFFIDRQIQKKLQYLELSLDNKLNNFIFLIAYGFMIYMIENLEQFGIEIEANYLPILKSPNNIKVIAELLERFITKSSIKINNKSFDDINQFLLERKEIKKQTKKKANDNFDSKRINLAKQGTNVKLKGGSDSEQSSNDEDSINSHNDNGNVFQETQDESQDDDLNLDAIIDKLQKSLYYESDYELSVSQIQSQVESSSSLKTHFLQVSLSTLFQIHNIYSQNHSNSDLFVITQDKVEKAQIKEEFKKFDPIYIIFSYLQFEPINVEDFQTEILERKVNLKLSNDLNYFSYQILKVTDFYKCLDCQAILPIHYLPSNQQLIIKKIKTDMREQWKCSKGHLNSLKSYKCTEFTCDEFIEEDAIKNFRIIKYYNVSKEYNASFYKNKEKMKQIQPDEMELNNIEDELTKKEILMLIYKVLKNCDPLKEGENEYQFFEKFSKKPRMRENPDLKNSVIQLLEELKKGLQVYDEEDNADYQIQSDQNFDKMRNHQDDLESQGTDDDREKENKKQEMWNEKFKYYKDMLGKVIDNRRVHSQKQRLVQKALTHADALLLENIAKLQDIVIKKQKTLAILINSLIPESVKQSLKYQQKLQELEEGPLDKNKKQEKGNKKSDSDLKKPDSFAYYTTQKLFKKKALISICFSSQNQQIVEIEKSIKFYIFCNNEGSFEILIVYAKEEFLDNFTSYNKHLFPNRMLLHKIYISVAQYREMKRLEYTKTNITFSTDTIKITFDMNKLVRILSKKEGKIFQLV